MLGSGCTLITSRKKTVTFCLGIWFFFPLNSPDPHLCSSSSPIRNIDLNHAWLASLSLIGVYGFSKLSCIQFATLWSSGRVRSNCVHNSLVAGLSSLFRFHLCPRMWVITIYTVLMRKSKSREGLTRALNLSSASVLVTEEESNERTRKQLIRPFFELENGGHEQSASSSIRTDRNVITN